MTRGRERESEGDGAGLAPDRGLHAESALGTPDTTVVAPAEADAGRRVLGSWGVGGRGHGWVGGGRRGTLARGGGFTGGETKAQWGGQRCGRALLVQGWVSGRGGRGLAGHGTRADGADRSDRASGWLGGTLARRRRRVSSSRGGCRSTRLFSEAGIDGGARRRGTIGTGWGLKTGCPLGRSTCGLGQTEWVNSTGRRASSGRGRGTGGLAVGPVVVIR